MSASRDGVVAASPRVGVRLRAYRLFEERGDRHTYLLEVLLVGIILINSASLILWTMPDLREGYSFWFRLSENCTVGVFVFEYAVRFWAAAEGFGEGRSWRRRVRFMMSPAALIDGAVLLPSLAALVILLTGGEGLSLSFLLVIRLLTRSAKLARYLPGGRRLGMAIRSKSGQLLTAVVGLLVVLVLAAALMYFAEARAQPEVFSSIPAAMWWSAVTLTTVGYGDTVPVTGIGRLLAAVIAVLGIGLFALPAGILSAAMVEANEAAEEAEGAGSPSLCPHCGGELGS